MNKKQLLGALAQYRSLRPGTLASPEFRHLLLLLFWPLFGVAFWAVEKWESRDWTAVDWPFLDELIPFCELFVIPYMFWFLFLAGMVAFTLLFDKTAFSGMMRFIILTYSITLLIYLLWPNKQELRPLAFERDNFLTRFMADFYAYDTNTNVCPSIHVLGSVAVLFASWHSKFFRHTGWKVYFWVWTILISVSTVFLKQHSAIDLLAALALSALVYPFAFHPSGVRSLWSRCRENKRLNKSPNLSDECEIT